MRMRRGEADTLGQLQLGQAKHRGTLAKAGTYMLIGGIGPLGGDHFGDPGLTLPE